MTDTPNELEESPEEEWTRPDQEPGSECRPEKPARMFPGRRHRRAMWQQGNRYRLALEHATVRMHLAMALGQ